MQKGSFASCRDGEMGSWWGRKGGKERLKWKERKDEIEGQRGGGFICRERVEGGYIGVGSRWKEHW